MKAYDEVTEKEKEQSKQLVASWGEVGDAIATFGSVVLGLTLMAVGIFYLTQTGDSSILQQGVQSFAK